ncbi:MAG: hypothetical protein ACRDCI_11905 [Plesiomonas shigelloides]
MSRCLLHKNKLDMFKLYLSENGIDFRDGRGDYQVIQVRIDGCWHAIYERANMPEHLTVVFGLERLVRKFIRQSKDKK